MLYSYRLSLRTPHPTYRNPRIPVGFDALHLAAVAYHG